MTRSPHTITDDKWPADHVITAAQSGDPAAIAVLLAGSQAHVKRFARSLCASPEDAEDAAQEALIVLYRKIGTLRATAALGSWMFRIVCNECMRKARAGLRKPPHSALSEQSAEDAVLAQLELQRVVDAVATLPAEQRSVLVLRDLQGYSGSATAAALGLSRAAMKSRLHRAREALRAQLREPAGAVVGDVRAFVGDERNADRAEH
jgi:RNA polymerase sigma factor (sigma-70 family)